MEICRYFKNQVHRKPVTTCEIVNIIRQSAYGKTAY